MDQNQNQYDVQDTEVEATEVLGEAEELISEEELAAEAESYAAEEDLEDSNDDEAGKKKIGAGKVVAIVLGSIVAVALILSIAIVALVGVDEFIVQDDEGTHFKFDAETWLAIKRLVITNPYNEMGYMNFSGRNIQQVADDAGMELADFLAEYGLPADMPPDTIEEAAYNSIPLGVFAEQMYGIDVETFKEAFQLGDDVDENTPYGVAEGKVKLSVAIGEDNIEAFKAEYGFGDEVTGDTLWGEVRPVIEKIAYEQQMAAEAESEAAADVLVEDEAEVEDVASETEGEQTEE